MFSWGICIMGMSLFFLAVFAKLDLQAPDLLVSLLPVGFMIAFPLGGHMMLSGILRSIRKALHERVD